MKKLFKVKINKLQLIKIIISIIGILVAIVTVQHIIRYIKYHKFYATWTGSKTKDGIKATTTFKLMPNGTFEYKEFHNDDLNRMLHGKYEIKDNWAILHNSNNSNEVIEFLYKEGRLFNDGTAYYQ